MVKRVGNRIYRRVDRSPYKPLLATYSYKVLKQVNFFIKQKKKLIYF